MKQQYNETTADDDYIFEALRNHKLSKDNCTIEGRSLIFNSITHALVVLEASIIKHFESHGTLTGK